MLFISGPYSGKTHDAFSVKEISENIEKAKQAAIFCATHQVLFFCPHLHTAHFEIFCPKVPIKFYYELDKKFLSICNGIILLDKWEYSKGSVEELKYFTENNFPFFRFPDQKEVILAWWQFELTRKEKESA